MSSDPCNTTWKFTMQELQIMTYQKGTTGTLDSFSAFKHYL